MSWRLILISHKQNEKARNLLLPKKTFKIKQIQKKKKKNPKAFHASVWIL